MPYDIKGKMRASTDPLISSTFPGTMWKRAGVAEVDMQLWGSTRSDMNVVPTRRRV
jgi:hypothetical protein